LIDNEANLTKKKSLQDFSRSLIKAAQTNRAWIITDGFNTGLVKHIGEAVRENSYYLKSNTEKIVLIGIAPWHSVLHYEELKGTFKVRIKVISPEKNIFFYWNMPIQEDFFYEILKKKKFFFIYWLGLVSVIFETYKDLNFF
jgi:hypothetical protein